MGEDYGDKGDAETLGNPGGIRFPVAGSHSHRGGRSAYSSSVSGKKETMSNKGISSGTWFVIALLLLVVVSGVFFFGRQGSDSSGIRLVEPRNLRPRLIEGLPNSRPVEVDPEQVARLIPVEEANTIPISNGETGIVKESDQDYLDSVVHRWVYLAYANVGGTKQGQFCYNIGSRERFTVNEGENREDVNLSYLDNSKAHASYGTAMAVLPKMGEFRADPRRVALSPDARFDSSPEAVAKAKRYYWEYYGKRLEYESRGYQPAPGERMPPKEPPTREEVEANVEKYIDQVMERLEKRKNQDGQTFTREGLRDSLHKRFGVGKYAKPEEDQVDGTTTEKPVLVTN